MRRSWLLLLVMIIPAPVRAQQEYGVSHHDRDLPSLRLIIAPHVSQELDRLADTLQVETVRCLIGVVRARSAMIDLAWTPPIEVSAANRVKYQSCPSATLALWHNHPRFPGEEPEYACYLSATDILEAVRPIAPPIQIVQVTGAVACWWSRRQIARAAARPILFPALHQRWGRPLALDEASCRDELRHLVACMLLLHCERGAEDCLTPRPSRDVATLGREGSGSLLRPACQDAGSRLDPGGLPHDHCARSRP